MFEVNLVIFRANLKCLGALHSFIAGKGPLQGEEGGGKAVATLAVGEKECCRNGNAAHESHLEEPETRPEEEQHNSNDSADSRSEGQQ